LETLTGWRASRSLSNILDAVEAFWHENRDRIATEANASTACRTTAELLPQEVA
jgi:hypothetical protein